jgi:hypothetical protein
LAAFATRAKTLPGDWGVDQAAREGSAAVSSRQKQPRIVPLPFATFGELLAFGLQIHAWCGSCKSMRKVDIGPRRLRRPFAGTRLRCRCGGYGHPSIQLPASRKPIDGASEYCDLLCSRCVPPWEIRHVRFDLLPWSACALASGECFGCPGCGAPVTMLTYNRRGTPFTSHFHGGVWG